jgi:hypothetical protein
LGKKQALFSSEGYKMSSDSGSPPTPDYAGAAQQQGVANQAAARTSARLSNPNVTNVYGQRRVTFGVDGDPDQVNINDTLSPQQQALFDQQQGINTRLGTAAGSLADRVAQTSATPFSFTGSKDLVDKAQTALLSRLDPILERENAARKTALITGGHAVGSEGFGTQMGLQGQKENDAHMQAILQALGYAPQLLQQEIATRQQPFNELATLRSGSPATVPSFQNYSGVNVAPAPIFAGAQAQGQADMNRYNAGVGQQNAMLGGLFSLGGAALGAPVGTFRGLGSAFGGV